MKDPNAQNTRARSDSDPELTADEVRGRTLSMDDLFPPKGRLYLTDERIASLRHQAVQGGEVTLPALTILELICDWKNMRAALTDGVEEGRTDG